MRAAPGSAISAARVRAAFNLAYATRASFISVAFSLARDIMQFDWESPASLGSRVEVSLARDMMQFEWEDGTVITASLGSASFSLACDAMQLSPASFRIRPGRTKHGLRERWRASEFAQLAIQELHGANPPAHIDVSRLTRDVNAQLKNNPDYRTTGLGEISRQTVLRALNKIRS